MVFGMQPEASDAVLAFDEDWAITHAPGCACCVTRTPAAQALDQLFLDRVRGTVPWFNRLVVDPAGEATVREAVTDDPVASARFRLG